MDAACTEDWKPAAASVHRTEKRLLLPRTCTGAEENAVHNATFLSWGMRGVTVVSNRRQAPFIE